MDFKKMMQDTQQPWERKAQQYPHIAAYNLAQNCQGRHAMQRALVFHEMPKC